MEPLPCTSDLKCLKTLLGFGKQTDFGNNILCCCDVWFTDKVSRNRRGVTHREILRSLQRNSEDWEKGAPTKGTQSRPDKNFSTTVQTLLWSIKLPVEQSTPV